MCYDIDFGISEKESSFEEVREVHAYRRQRVIQPEDVAAHRAELSFLTRLLVRLMVILVLIRRIKGTLMMNIDI